MSFITALWTNTRVGSWYCSDDGKVARDLLNYATSPVDSCTLQDILDLYIQGGEGLIASYDDFCASSTDNDFNSTTGRLEITTLQPGDVYGQFHCILDNGNNGNNNASMGHFDFVSETLLIMGRSPRPRPPNTICHPVVTTFAPLGSDFDPCLQVLTTEQACEEFGRWRASAQMDNDNKTNITTTTTTVDCTLRYLQALQEDPNDPTFYEDEISSLCPPVVVEVADPPTAVQSSNMSAATDTDTFTAASTTTSNNPDATASSAMASMAFSLCTAASAACFMACMALLGY